MLIRTQSYRLLFLAGIGIAGCSDARPETASYFEQKTGLKLCSSAKLENIQIGNHDQEPDFTYGVLISMSEKCESQLSQEIYSRLKVSCYPSRNCDFMDSNSWSYEIRKLADGRLKFVLRAT